MKQECYRFLVWNKNFKGVRGKPCRTNPAKTEVSLFLTAAAGFMNTHIHTHTHTHTHTQAAGQHESFLYFHMSASFTCLNDINVLWTLNLNLQLKVFFTFWIAGWGTLPQRDTLHGRAEGWCTLHPSSSYVLMCEGLAWKHDSFRAVNTSYLPLNQGRAFTLGLVYFVCLVWDPVICMIIWLVWLKCV